MRTAPEVAACDDKHDKSGGPMPVLVTNHNQAGAGRTAVTGMHAMHWLHARLSVGSATALPGLCMSALPLRAVQAARPGRQRAAPRS